jgi:uncharacterized protein YprB with RNaseH-like and TPR domain
MITFSTMSRYPIDRHGTLKRSFVHLDGIGPKTERQLWEQGITDWERLHADAPALFKGKRLPGIQRALDQSLAAWDRGDLYYFHRTLPGDQRWRLVPSGVEDIAYFDIEASGGNFPPICQSTAVAFYFRGDVLQEHEHQKKRELIDYILDEASVLCTYNGGGYDVPFLSHEYGIRFEKAHVDLCPWLRRQGFKGGLKKIQRAHPHVHQRCSMDIDGYDAVRLWRMHQQGVQGALETLLTYNAEDALILEPLLVEAYNREVEVWPALGLAKLTSAPIPPLATDVCPKVYTLLRAGSTPDADGPGRFLENLA